jgi:urea transport system permease protein
MIEKKGQGTKRGRLPSRELMMILLVCALIAAMPTILNNDYILNRVARYLVLGIVAMSLALSWGYGGILNLGQAMSFGVGSYAMAMALKLKTVPVQTGPEGLPRFHGLE